MADRYWVGGSGSWDGNAASKWSTTFGGAGGASVPTSADDVYFDSYASSASITIAAGNLGAKSIRCTSVLGDFIGTLTGTAPITVSGNITLVSSMTYSHTGTVTINATSTLTTAGKTFSALVVDGSGITVTLGSALNTSTRSVTVSQGTLNTSASNYNITAGALLSNSASTRTITLNGSTVTLSDGTTPLDIRGTGLTFNANTSTITCTGINISFFGGGKSFNNVSFTNSTPGSVTLYDANTFSSLTLTAPASATVRNVFIDSDFTATTFVCAGASAIRRIWLSSLTPGTRRTITNTTWTTISDVDFTDIGISRAISGTRLGDGKNNNNITFDAPKTVYWNLAGTQNWNATAWATTATGTPAVNNFPLAQDTAVFTNSGAAGTISAFADYLLGNMDMSARTSAMTFDGGLYVLGNWTNGTGVTVSGSNPIIFFGRTTQTLTSSGVTFAVNVRINTVGGSVVLQDAFSSSRADSFALDVVRGTFDANGFNVTLSGSTSSVRSNYDTSRTIAVGSGTWTIAGSGGWNASTSTNLTVTGTGTISFTSASAKSFQGGGISYSGITLNQGGSGALSITGANTLGNISNTYSATGATTITFAANQTVSNFTATGTSGKVLTINSSSTGVRRTLTKTGGGIVSVNFMSIRDSGAAGVGATWYAGANSTNVSNNTGWVFSAAPSPSSFLMFFN